MRYINIPGLYNSGEQHWQSLWELQYPHQFSRVQQKDWTAPVKSAWVDEIRQSVNQTEGSVILVAHSLGCNTVAHWAQSYGPGQVSAALLVAPVSIEKTTRDCFTTFLPTPVAPLPFPSIVVASTNDPYTSMEQSAKLAAWWGSRFVCVGDKGHINAASGLANWEEGYALLNKLSNLNSRKEIHHHASPV